MKILEICPFSAGICGVWSRVKQESLEFSKLGHKVTIFSSNIVKGTNKIVSPYEEIQGIKIKRLKGKKSLLSENVIDFHFKRELKKTNPDLVITHLIHPHSFKALDICRKKRIPCYLVTHAPFFAKRNFLLSLATSFYYLFWTKLKIDKFTRIITITQQESSYLSNLGVSKDKITYIPNGIPLEFFKEKITKFHGKDILFVGRIAPIKDLETLISAFKRIESKNIKLDIIGPVEQGYEHIKNSKSKNIEFVEPISDLKKKIKKFQEADIFILPSKREAMPQSLIEAMSLGKIVIASDTLGAKNLIADNQNGFLFKIGDKEGLKNKIIKVLGMKPDEISKIQKNARNSVKKYNWDNLINSYTSLFKNDFNNNNSL